MLLIAEVGPCQLYVIEGDPFEYELFGGGPDARFTNLLTAAQEFTTRTTDWVPDDEQSERPRLRSV